MPVEVMDAESLRRALLDAEWREAPLTDAISPCTPISFEQDLEIEVPAALPRILVGVRRSAGVSAPCLDVTLSSDDELREFAQACDANPHAAVALAQLLRMSERLDVEAALVAESLAYSTLLRGAEFARWRTTNSDREVRTSRQPVLLDDDGETLTVTLHRPEVHNAYDAGMRDALIDILRSALAMQPGRGVMLRGEGPSFCSGGDLGEFGTSGDNALAHLVRTARSPGLLLHQLGARATALVHGSCIGAGTELPAFCARVYAHPDARFQLPELSMGLIPGAGGTVSVARRIGRRRTMWMATTGAVINTETASQWGLVDAVSA